MTILLDFDGTLVSQRRPEAFLQLAKTHAVPRTDDLPRRLFDDDRFLCRHEIYDRTWLFRCFSSEFPGKLPSELCDAFWNTVTRLQEPLDGCVEAVIELRRKGHRLFCATDTDGPGLHKKARVDKLVNFFDRQCGIKLFDGVFIGSETVGARSGKIAPPKGGLEFIEFILQEVDAKKQSCVMIGDKAETDLLPASASGISSVLVPNPDYQCDWPVRVNSLRELPELIDALRFGIFISYSRLDEAFVERMEQTLALEGIKLWRDKRDALIGDHVEQMITKAIRTNPGFLVVLTDNSVNSGWVQKEIIIATKRRMRGKNWIFPVLAETNVTLPNELKDLNYADCSGDKFAQGMSAVIATIKRRSTETR